MSGRETEVLTAKPGDAESDALEDIRRSWSSSGLVVDEYCPGRSWMLVAAPEADSVAPTKTSLGECWVPTNHTYEWCS